MSDEVLNYAITGDSSGAKAAFNDVGASIAASAKRVDDLAKSLQGSAGKMDKHAESATKMAESTKSAVEGASGSLGQFTTGLQSAAQAIPGVSSSMDLAASIASKFMSPMVALPAALVGVTTTMFHFAEANAATVVELEHMHEKTGISINELAALKKTGEFASVGLDEVTAAVGKMNVNMGKGAEAFRSLRITSADPLEALAQVADRYNAASTAAEKAKVGSAAFGKSYREIVPLLVEGGAKIREAAQSSVLSQGMIDRYEDIHHKNIEIEQSWRKVKTAIGDVVSGPLQDMLAIMAEIAKYETSWVTDFRKAHGEAANIQDAEKFLDSHMHKQTVFDDPNLPKQGRIVSSVDGPKLIADLKKMNEEERAKILDGIMRLDKDNADPRFRSLLDKNGMINGLDPAALGSVQAETNRAAIAARNAKPPSDDAEKAAEKAAEAWTRMFESIEKTANEEVLKANGFSYGAYSAAHPGSRSQRTAIKNSEGKVVGYGAGAFALGTDADSEAAELARSGVSLRAQKEAEESAKEAAKAWKEALDNADKLFEKANGIGYGAYSMAHPGGTDEDSASAEASRSASTPQARKKQLEEQKKAAEELKKQYEAVANYVSSDFANAFTREFVQIQRGHESLMQGLRNGFGSFFSDVEQQLIHFTAEWLAKMAIMKAADAFLGKSGSAASDSSGSSGIGSVFAALGGLFATGGTPSASSTQDGTDSGDYTPGSGDTAYTADGTLSFRGGMTTLSERGGMERVLTPQGGDFYASRGLYAMAPGSQVIPANQAQGAGGRMELHQHFHGADPVQMAEQGKRVAMETVSQWDKDGFRSRGIYQ